MGVLNRGILGGFRGSVGPVTGTSWKGIDVMKSKPLSVANPRSPGQVTQRGKFSAAVALASAILVACIKPLWDRFAQRQSGFNAFIAANIDNFDGSGNIIDAALLALSQGTLANIDSIIAGSITAAGVLDITWLSTLGFDTDEIYVLVVNENSGAYGGVDTGATRVDGTWSGATGVEAENGDEIQVLISCRRADGTQVSNTLAYQFTASI